MNLKNCRIHLTTDKYYIDQYKKILQQEFCSELQCDIIINDKYNEFSLFFIVLHTTRVIGGFRVVLPNAIGFPLEESITFPANLSKKNTAEMSRAYLCKEFRNNDIQIYSNMMKSAVDEINKINREIETFVLESILQKKIFYSRLGFYEISAPFIDKSLNTVNDNAILMAIEKHFLNTKFQ